MQNYLGFQDSSAYKISLVRLFILILCCGLRGFLSNLLIQIVIGYRYPNCDMYMWPILVDVQTGI